MEFGDRLKLVRKIVTHARTPEEIQQCALFIGEGGLGHDAGGENPDPFFVAMALVMRICANPTAVANLETLLDEIATYRAQQPSNG